MIEDENRDPLAIIPEAIGNLESRGDRSRWLRDLLQSGDARDPADVLMDLEFAVEMFGQKFEAVVKAATRSP